MKFIIIRVNMINHIYFMIMLLSLILNLILLIVIIIMRYHKMIGGVIRFQYQTYYYTIINYNIFLVLKNNFIIYFMHKL